MVDLTEEEIEDVRGLRSDLGVSIEDLASQFDVLPEAIEATLGPELASPRSVRVVDPSFLETLDEDEGRPRTTSPDAAEAVLRWLSECGGSR